MPRREDAAQKRESFARNNQCFRGKTLPRPAPFSLLFGVVVPSAVAGRLFPRRINYHLLGCWLRLCGHKARGAGILETELGLKRRQCGTTATTATKPTLRPREVRSSRLQRRNKGRRGCTEPRGGTMPADVETPAVFRRRSLIPRAWGCRKLYVASIG